MNTSQIEPKRVTLTISQAANHELEVKLDVKYARDNTHASDPSTDRLVALPQQLLDAYTAWRQNYLVYGRNRGLIVPSHPIETNVSISIEDCDKLKDKFVNEFDRWLSGLTQIRENLLAHVSRAELISFVVQTETNDPQLDLALHRLPWNEWNFIHKHYDTEIALSTKHRPIIRQKEGKLRALAICGSYEQPEYQLDLQPDLAALSQSLANSAVELEIWQADPTQNNKLDLLKKLDLSTYHLLFFCGHSSANNQIQLNDRESISLEDPRFQRILIDLRKRGLILAFFNSCEGLGNASILMSAGIPYVVVMKEIVHDVVAQEFITYFLNSATEPNKPIHLAVREARAKLWYLDKLPHGEFLPVLFQNPDQPLFYINPVIREIAPPPQPSDDSSVKPSASHWLARWLLGTKSAPVVLACLILLSLANLLLFIYTANRNQPNITLKPPVNDVNSWISAGDRTLTGSHEDRDSESGHTYFSLKQYDKSAAAFDRYLTERGRAENPQFVIFSSNAKAYQQVANAGGKILKIATSVPLGSNQDIAKEILRGVAQQQIEFNRRSPTLQLVVIIGNDDNLSDKSQKIAQKFVEDPEILAVIGHNASNASEEAAKVYNRQLVMLSPTSFSTKLKKDDRQDSIYRMVPQMTSFASQLATYIRDDAKQQNTLDRLRVGICFDPDSPDNNSFQSQFDSILSGIASKPENLNCGSFTKIDRPQNQQQILQRMRDLKINILLVAPHVDRLKETVTFMQAVKRDRAGIKLIGSPSLYTQYVAAFNRDKLLDNLVLTVPYFPLKDNQFVTNFKREWRIPLQNWRSTMSYAATSVIAQYLSPTATRQSIKTALATDRVYNLAPTIDSFSFNSNGERTTNAPPGRLIRLVGTEFQRLDK
jgi:branched-chain amino acid transport system substrate-binding protein